MSEPAAGESPFLPEGVAAGFLLLQGYRDGCCLGFGCWPAGSGSFLP